MFVFERQLEKIIDRTVTLVPRYEVNAVDVNEALDFGVGNCAVRAYLAGCQVLDKLDPDNIEVRFGYTDDNHGLIEGKRIYGHAVIGLWTPDGQARVVESGPDGEMYLEQVQGYGFDWKCLGVGYRQYLDELDRRDVRFSRPDVTKTINRLVTS